MVAVLKSDHDFSAELRPYQANVLSNRHVRRKYGFDVLVAREGSEEYAEYIAFFPTGARQTRTDQRYFEDFAMITSEAQLQQAVNQMGRMYRALAALHSDVLPQSRQQFALMAEGPLEEMRRLEQEISAYVNHTLNMPEILPRQTPLRRTPLDCVDI